MQHGVQIICTSTFKIQSASMHQAAATMRTFQWLFSMEVILHALNNGIQLLDTVYDERKILYYEATGSLWVLGPGLLVSR